MGDEDKPFMCPELHCGMSFTNEDHLSVHMRKHDMSLALNLTTSAGLSPLSLFTDQTPTPTKFLKNCEEIGLFQELTKNPFDDSFKKAMDDPMEGATLQPPLPGPVGGDLDTPQPDVVETPSVVVSQMESPSVIPVQDTDGVLLHNEGATKHKDMTETSILPKKRKKFMSQSQPTSTTTEDEDEPTIGSTTMSIPDIHIIEPTERVDNSPPTVSSSTLEQQQTRITSPEQIVVRTDAVPSTAADAVTNIQIVKQPAAPVTAPQNPLTVQVLLQLPGGMTLPVQVPAASLAQPQQFVQLSTAAAGSVPQVVLPPAAPQIVQGISPGNLPTNVQKVVKTVSVTNPTNMPLNVKTIMLGGASALTHQTGSVPSNIPSNVKTVQLGTSQLSQQTGAVTSNLPLNLKTITLGTSPLAHGSGVTTIVNQKATGVPAMYKTVVKSDGLVPQQVAASKPVVPPQGAVIQSVPGQNKTLIAGGSQAYTKQRLKAALQQQTTPSSNQKISQIFQMVEVKQEPQGSPHDVSSSSGSMSPEDRTMGMMPMSKLMPESAEDAENRRLKFLERNRAAAARCRQKRKHWVTNLETKAEEMTAINNKLSAEIKQLRGEVAHLKTLLLAHKDCPITLQQRSTGQITSQTYVIDPVSSESNSVIVNDANTGVIYSAIPHGDHLVPNVVELDSSPQTENQPVDLLPSIMNQTTTLPVSVNGKLVPTVISINQSTGEEIKLSSATATSTGVITGPNSLNLIPKIIGVDPHMNISVNPVTHLNTSVSPIVDANGDFGS